MLSNSIQKPMYTFSWRGKCHFIFGELQSNLQINGITISLTMAMLGTVHSVGLNFSDQLGLQKKCGYKTYLTTLNTASTVNSFHWLLILLQSRKLGSLEKYSTGSKCESNSEKHWSMCLPLLGSLAPLKLSTCIDALLLIC